MHLAITLIISTLLTCLFPTAGAVHYPRAGSVTQRSSHKLSPEAQLIAKRQYHVHRDLLDLCVSVDAGVLFPLLQLVDPLAAKAHLCLCLNDLDIFLDTDIGILLGRLLGSKDNLLAVLKLFINTYPHSQQCTFPPHSHHLCAANNPCGFQCDLPYVQSGRTCVCPLPLKECNGQCGNFPNGCGSAVPRPLKQKRVTEPITTLSQAQASCKPNQSVCGVPGREENLAFECIDTTTTLDSCGGCVTPHRFLNDTPVLTGIDCGHLPGVVVSGCVNSRCRITQCRTGWRVNSDRSACVDESDNAPKGGHSSRMKKERRGGFGNTALTLDSELDGKLKVYVQLVIDLMDASTSVSAPYATPQGPALSTFNYTELLGTIVVATTNVLSSHTSVKLITNINTMVEINDLVAKALGQCGCVATLKLQPVVSVLLKVTAAALDIQYWCAHHPISPSNPSPPHDAPIAIGLDYFLDSLGVYSKNSRIDLSSLDLSSELTSAINDRLNALGIGPANVRPLKRFISSGSITINSRANSELAHGFPHANGSSVTATQTNVDATLLTQLRIVANLVLSVKHQSGNLPVAPHHGSPTGLPASGAGSLPEVNIDLVDLIVNATVDLLKSRTITTLLVRLDTLADVNALVNTTLTSCGCIDGLSLHGLSTSVSDLVTAVLGVREWCSHHPVAPPTTPSYSLSLGSPTATVRPSQAPQPDASQNGLLIDLGLHNLIDALLGHSDIYVDGDVNLNGLLDAVVKVVVRIQDHSSTLPPGSPHGQPATPTSGLAPHTHSLANQGLVDALVNATANLLLSATSTDVTVNVNTLLGINGLFTDALDHCGCVGHLGLEKLVEDVDNLLDELLTLYVWCQQHPGGGFSGPGDAIIINAHDLLAALGLGDAVKVDGTVKGLLGGGFDGLVNGLLKSLGLGGR